MDRACSRQIIIPGMDALVLQLHEEGIPSKLSVGRSETVPMALTIPKTRNCLSYAQFYTLSVPI